MDAHDPLRDYETQPSWSPITPTSPARKLEFPDKDTFDVHAFVDNEPAEEKSATNPLVKPDSSDNSIEQIKKSGIEAGPAAPDYAALRHIWKEVKKALRNQLKEELRAELHNGLREELAGKVRRELQLELEEQTKETQGIVKMEEGKPAQQVSEPFAPVLLGPIKPGFEDGDARVIAELDEAMKEVDERMARMDEEREKGFEEEMRG